MDNFYRNSGSKLLSDAIFNNLALIYDNQGKYEEAIRFYLMAIEKGNIKAMFNLAMLYENQGNDEEAIRFYLMAIEKGDKDAMYNLGCLYMNLSKYEYDD
jgi:TPR repeat protein